MNKILIAVAGIATILAGCGDKTAYDVKIPVAPDLKGKEIVLVNALTGDTVAAATAADSIATFKGKIEKPVLVVALAGQMPVAQLVVQPGSITVDKEGIATGTPDNDAFAAFNKAAEADQEHMDRLALEFMEKNPANPYSMALFNSFSYLAPVSLIDTLAALNPDLADNPNLAMLRVNAEAREKTGVGAKYVDFTIAQPDAKAVSLSEYMAGKKLTIVDFWASWCPPCRAEIPGLIKLYNEYKDKGLQVVGVDVWEREEGKGQEAVKTLGIDYPVIYNGDQATTSLYGIMAIPVILVIDEEGTIISRNMMGEELAAFIAEKMK